MNAKILGVTILGLLASATFANAQPTAPGGGVSRPGFSPYLNLLRSGASPTLNYYGLVKPEQQFRQQNNQLQQQLQQANSNLQNLNNFIVAGGDANIPITGHGATFNNTLHYFSSYPRGGGGGFGGSGGGGFNRGISQPQSGSAMGGRGGPSTAGNGIPRR